MWGPGRPRRPLVSVSTNNMPWRECCWGFGSVAGGGIMGRPEGACGRGCTISPQDRHRAPRRGLQHMDRQHRCRRLRAVLHHPRRHRILRAPQPLCVGAGVGTRSRRRRVRTARVRYSVVREGESGRMSAPERGRRHPAGQHAADGHSAARWRAPDHSRFGGEARRARSVALRDALRGGAWDAAAVYSAFLGSEPKLF